MADKSVCIRCGEFKRFVSDGCGACGFKPESDEDIAKSFVLSESFDAGRDVYGKSTDELARISGLIRGRQPYEFDPKELKQHLKGYREFKKITPEFYFWI